MLENNKEKLSQLLKWRTEFETTIRARIAELREEKRQAIEMYDSEIEDLETQLAVVGIPVTEHPGTNGNTALAEQLYTFLCDHAGEWVSARDINRAFKNNGVLTVILNEHLADGRVERLGKSYRVDVAQPNPE